MKKILCFLILCTCAAHAQKFEIALNGGISFHSAPDVASLRSSAPQTETPGAVLPLASLKFMYYRKAWQYGLQADYRQLAYYNSPVGMFVFIPGESLERRQKSYTYISRAAFPFKAFIDHSWFLHKLEVYGGISGGYWLAAQCEDPNALASVYFDKVNGNGFSAGLQAGGTYYVTKHFGLNGDINADLLWLTVGAASYRLIDFPVTLGLRYRF